MRGGPSKWTSGRYLSMGDLDCDMSEEGACEIALNEGGGGANCSFDRRCMACLDSRSLNFIHKENNLRSRFDWRSGIMLFGIRLNPNGRICFYSFLRVGLIWGGPARVFSYWELHVYPQWMTDDAGYVP